MVFVFRVFFYLFHLCCPRINPSNSVLVLVYTVALHIVLTIVWLEPASFVGRRNTRFQKCVKNGQFWPLCQIWSYSMDTGKGVKRSLFASLVHISRTLDYPNHFPFEAGFGNWQSVESKILGKSTLRKNEKNWFFQVTKSDLSLQHGRGWGPDLIHQHFMKALWCKAEIELKFDLSLKNHWLSSGRRVLLGHPKF